MFMGGPVHEWLGWLPIAYRYFGVNMGYGARIAAQIDGGISFGKVTKCTKVALPKAK
jgi:hypothetical protein